MILKGQLKFLLVQLPVLWNFSQGYLRPCTDTSLGAPNGTTVYAEIGKPVSVLFCVENGTSIHYDIDIKKPHHRAGWSRVNSRKVVKGKESIVVKTLIINDVQERDLNVTFSVNIYTNVYMTTTGYRNDEWLFFTFILQKKASIRLCHDSIGWSPNGINVDASFGGSAHVVFCVTSEVSIHKHVFIHYPSSRSGWYPPTFATKLNNHSNDVDVKFAEEKDHTKIIINITNIDEKDFKSNFSVKVMSEQHAFHPETNKEFVSLKFQLLQKDSKAISTSVPSTISIHSGSTSQSKGQSSTTVSTLENNSQEFSVNTASTEKSTAKVTETTTISTSTPSTTATTTTTTPRSWLQITNFSMTTSSQPGQTITRNLTKTNNDIISIAPRENNMTLTCVGNGNPEPEMAILLNNIPLQLSSRGEARHVIQNITCKDSGIYTCEARNTFNSTQIQRTIKVKRPDDIESFTIQSQQPVYSVRSSVKMVCTAAKCSEPLTMRIVDDTGADKNIVHLNESVVYEIRNVQCSDMGTYFCRAETENKTTLEEQQDLKISNCAPQVCHGKNRSKTVHALVGQNVSVSVCIVSYNTLSWWNRLTYSRSRVQVLFTPRPPNFLYYTVTITISDIQEQDGGKKRITLSSGYSNIDFTINLQVDTTTTTTSSSPLPSAATITASTAGDHVEGRQPTTNSESGINVLYIGLPLAVFIVIVVVILGVIIYRRRCAGFRTRKARTDDVCATNEGEYANLKELDSATATVVEEEQVTSVTKDGGQVLASDFSDQDSGRFLSDQGLVYLSIAHVANSNKKKTKQEKRTADKLKAKGGKKDREVETVEYITIDFAKTGKQVITKEEEKQRPKDEENQENKLADEKEETEKNEDEQDENNS